MLSRRRLLDTFILGPFLLVTLAFPHVARAQADPAVRDRVVPAAVAIAILVDVTSEGRTIPHALPVGSGSIVSPDGLILTNWHVVDMSSHRARLTALEERAAEAGEALAIRLEEQGVLILTSDGSSPPQRTYLAEPVVHDADLDLAVLEIVGHIMEEGISTTVPSVPFIPLGDAAMLSLGDPLHIYGYPAAGGDSLTYTSGVTSGFNFEVGREDPVWITTDATLSGGSSGGAAVDDEGMLIGVPTQGSALDCQALDTNHDGLLDGQDLSCVPIGGSIGQIRPINLAAPLLEAARRDLGSDQPRDGLDKSAFSLHKSSRTSHQGEPDGGDRPPPS